MSEDAPFIRLAEVYEAFYIPALLDEWANLVAESARVQPGQRVLDVASGTGILARTVADRVGSGGEVIGIDPSDSMLAVPGAKPLESSGTEVVPRTCLSRPTAST